MSAGSRFFRERTRAWASSSSTAGGRSGAGWSQGNHLCPADSDPCHAAAKHGFLLLARLPSLHLLFGKDFVFHALLPVGQVKAGIAKSVNEAANLIRRCADPLLIEGKERLAFTAMVFVGMYQEQQAANAGVAHNYALRR